MTANGTERAIGQLQASVDHLESTVEGLSSQVQVLNAHMERQKGGWRALVAVGGAGGIIGGIITKYFPP